MNRLRRNYTHHQANDGIIKDWQGNYRVIFEMTASTNPRENRKMEQFMNNFRPEKDIEDAPILQWTSIGAEKPGARTIDVLVGYAQAFQTEFNTEFN